MLCSTCNSPIQYCLYTLLISVLKVFFVHLIVPEFYFILFYVLYHLALTNDFNKGFYSSFQIVRVLLGEKFGVNNVLVRSLPVAFPPSRNYRRSCYQLVLNNMLLWQFHFLTEICPSLIRVYYFCLFSSNFYWKKKQQFHLFMFKNCSIRRQVWRCLLWRSLWPTLNRIYT